MAKNIKVFTDKNPRAILFHEKEIGFEFVGDYEYQVLVNIVEQKAKIAMPNGTIIDNNFEYYFEEDEPFNGHDEFHEWLKFLLMSIEFYSSDIWKLNE